MVVPKRLEIEWLHDSYDCETCAGSWAQGAIIRFDGKVVFEFYPSAHCSGDDTMTECEVYEKVFELMGVEYIDLG